MYWAIRGADIDRREANRATIRTTRRLKVPNPLKQCSLRFCEFDFIHLDFAFLVFPNSPDASDDLDGPIARRNGVNALGNGADLSPVKWPSKWYRPQTGQSHVRSTATLGQLADTNAPIFETSTKAGKFASAQMAGPPCQRGGNSLLMISSVKRSGVPRWHCRETTARSSRLSFLFMVIRIHSLA